MPEAIGAIAAVSAVSSILQVIDFTLSVSKQTYRLIKSSEDALRENIEVERLARDYRLISEQICSSRANIDGLTGIEATSLKKADQCRQEASILLEMLEDLKIQSTVRGGRRLLHVAGKSAKAVRLKCKIESRIAHLDRLNGQLAISLVQLLGESQAASFDDLVARAQLTDKKTAARVREAREVILSAIEETRQGDIRDPESQVPCIGDIENSYTSSIPAARRCRYLETMSKKSKETADRIIDSLRFPEINHRRDTVVAAHQRTFDWIFEDESSPFLRWLKTSDDVFWITGKAGSGKSTLMKFLSGHKIVRGIVHDAANASHGSRQALLLEYYFWYLGTPMQKSLTGLLRSLLHQVLRCCPYAVPVATPERFTATPSFHDRPDSWTDSELWDSFSIIAKEDLSVDFYIFIDGLDEYDGDHQDLMELLQQLAENPRIRLCVSSRPWNVFDRAFGSRADSFRLEDLTRHDISIYVADKLRALHKDQDLDHLAGEIVDRAQGVFLWVYLVVAELRRGLNEGDDAKILKARLDKIPVDLEKYFDRILSRVDGIYSSQTAQLLKVAVLLAESRRKDSDLSSYLCFWLVCQGIDDWTFAFARPIRYCSHADLLAFAKETQRSLSARCKELLYFSLDNAAINDPDYDFQALKVDFLHRTVYEFLNNNIMEKVNSQLPINFTNPELLRHLTLAQLKLVPENATLLERYHGVIRSNLEDVRGTPMQKEFWNVSQHYHYLPWVTRTCHHFQSRYDRIRVAGDSICNSIDVCHGISSHPWPPLVSALGLLPQESFKTSAIKPDILQRLTSEGADPNEYVGCLHGNVWHLFLRKRMAEVAKIIQERATCAQPDSERYVHDYSEIVSLWNTVEVLMNAGADTTSVVDCYGLCSAFDDNADQTRTRNTQHCYHSPRILIAKITNDDEARDFDDLIRRQRKK